jgi:hypothetical protein
MIIIFLLNGCGYNGGSSAAQPSPSPTASDAVILQVGAASYQATSTINVTILNQSSQTISFTDHQTNCTVLLLERQTANSWESVAPCKMMIKTNLHSLKAGETLEVKLNAPGQWAGGSYRARLDYSVGSSATLHTVYANAFQVG